MFVCVFSGDGLGRGTVRVCVFPGEDWALCVFVCFQETDWAQYVFVCFQETGWVLYVFDRGGSAGEGAPTAVSLPPLVREMLQHTDHRPEYYRQVSVVQYRHGRNIIDRPEMHYGQDG